MKRALTEFHTSGPHAVNGWHHLLKHTLNHEGEIQTVSCSLFCYQVKWIRQNVRTVCKQDFYIKDRRTRALNRNVKHITQSISWRQLALGRLSAEECVHYSDSIIWESACVVKADTETQLQSFFFFKITPGENISATQLSDMWHDHNSQLINLCVICVCLCVVGDC